MYREAVKISNFMADFFVQEARKSSHTFPDRFVILNFQILVIYYKIINLLLYLIAKIFIDKLNTLAI